MINKSRRMMIALACVWLALLVAGCSSGASPTQSPLAVTPPAAAQVATDLPAATAAPAATETTQAAIPGTGQDSAQTTAVTRLNLNTATNADFLTIPGMGDRMVREFLEYRPYTSIEQFRREIGKYVSDDQVAQYEQYVYVPVAVNNADAATLMQIPGLDATEAQALIDARPFASNEAFLTALSAYVTADELSVAASYLDAQ